MDVLQGIRDKILHRQYEFSKHEVSKMKETMVESEVTYTLEVSGKFYIIEHVPARVCKETGEQYFSPDTVERIQALLKSNKQPDKMIQTPVYEFA